MFNLSDEDIDVVQRAQHLLGLTAILRLRDAVTQRSRVIRCIGGRSEDTIGRKPPKTPAGFMARWDLPRRSGASRSPARRRAIALVTRRDITARAESGTGMSSSVTDWIVIVFYSIFLGDYFGKQHYGCAG
jgi:hypothetical protein